MKRNISLMLVLTIFALMSISYSEDMITYGRHSTGYTWRLESFTKNTGISGGSWIHMYTGYPAARDGEIDTVTTSKSYSHTYSGSFGTTMIKGLVEAQLDYSFGTVLEFSISKSSASLNKGEYIKAYYRKTYSTSSSVSQQYYFDTSLITDIYTPTGNYAYATPKKAIFPQIKIEYYMSDGPMNYSISRLEKQIEKPHRVEVYDYVDGEFVLTE